MIVIMEAGIKQKDKRVEVVVDRAKSLGLNPEVTSAKGAEYELVQVLLKDGHVRSASLSEHFFQILSGVGSVQRVTPPAVSLAHHGNGSYHHVIIGRHKVGTNLPCKLVAGPCTVDKRIGEVVQNLAGIGVKIIRGGCWKPRSNPDSFPGFGRRGVSLLLEAAKENQMEGVFLEVIESSHIDIVRRVRDGIGYNGTIVLWVGARTGNTILLRKLGEQKEFPVMLKNGLDDQGISDIAGRAEWVLARRSVWGRDGQLVVKESLTPGNNQVILCLRGTRKTDKHSLFRFEPNHHWATRIHREWWAPVCIDPSHSAGEEGLVIENTEDALRFNPSLVMVEGGYNEDYRGLCDANQSVSIGNMPRIIELVSNYNEKMYGVRTF